MSTAPRWVCRMCVAEHGLKGSDLKDWPEKSAEDAIILHMESVHHIAVRRTADETEEEAQERLYQNYPACLSGYRPSPLAVVSHSPVVF